MHHCHIRIGDLLLPLLVGATWHVRNNTDLPAHNLPTQHPLPANITEAAALTECEQVCLATLQCTGFVYVSPALVGQGGPRCAFKTGVLASIIRQGCVAATLSPPAPPVPPTPPLPRISVTAHKLAHGFPAYDSTFCVRQLRHSFWSISSRVAQPPHLRAVGHTLLRAHVYDGNADRCLRSDVVANSPPQAATGTCTNASIFDQTFNPTYLRLSTGDDALIMRGANTVRNPKCGAACANNGYCANTSCADHLVLGRYNCTGGDGPGTGPEVAARMRCSHEKITSSSVVMRPSSPPEQCGLLDPRVTFNPATGGFIMAYWAYGDCPEPDPRQKASDDMLLATSTDGVDWMRRGELYGRLSGISPGVMVHRDPAVGNEHLLFYMSDWDHIAVVSTSDPRLLRWNMSAPNTIAASRNSPATAWNSTDPTNHFDNAHMEPAVAVELKSGLLLVLYTTVSTNGWPLQHNLTCTRLGGECWMPGYLLVDCGPTAASCQVVQRSTEPLLLPTLPWELQGACAGMGTSDALQRLDTGGADERFLLHYDAADMRVGAAVVTVAALARGVG